MSLCPQYQNRAALRRLYMSCTATLPDLKGHAPHDRDSRASASTCAGSTVCRVELLSTLPPFSKRIAFSNKRANRACERPPAVHFQTRNNLADDIGRARVDFA